MSLQRNEKETVEQIFSSSTFQTEKKLAKCKKTTISNYMSLIKTAATNPRFCCQKQKNSILHRFYSPQK